MIEEIKKTINSHLLDKPEFYYSSKGKNE